jgi:hypothetical protein
MCEPLTETEKLDETTFRDKNAIEMIRKYLLQHGAKNTRHTR